MHHTGSLNLIFLVQENHIRIIKSQLYSEQLFFGIEHVFKQMGNYCYKIKVDVI